MSLDFDSLKIVWNRSDCDLKDEAGDYVLPIGKYPSVTRIIDPNNDFLWVHIAKIKEEVDRLGALAAEGQDAFVWTQDETGAWSLVPAPALSVLMDGGHVSRAGLRYMKQAADRGTGIHFLFEAWGQGIHPSLADAKELSEWIVIENGLACDCKELESYLKPAICWLDKWAPEFEYQEMVLVDPERGYAGRTDTRRMKIDNVHAVGDVKSNDTLKRGWLMQTAAYRAAPIGYIRGGDTANRIDIPEEWHSDYGCIIMATPEKCGHRMVPPQDMDYYRDAFYSQLHVHNAIKSGPLPGGRASWVRPK